MANAPLGPEARALAGHPRHVAFARAMARKLARRRPRMLEEFESAALLALVESARTFDPARGRKFTGHAYRRILGAIQDLGRSQQLLGYRRGTGPAPEVRPVSWVLDGEDDRPDSWRAAPSGEGPVGWEAESIDAVRGLLAPLPVHVRRAMFLVYTEAKGTKAHAARKLGVCSSHVSQLHQVGLEMLRARLQPEARP